MDPGEERLDEEVHRHVGGVLDGGSVGPMAHHTSDPAGNMPPRWRIDVGAWHAGLL